MLLFKKVRNPSLDLLSVSHRQFPVPVVLHHDGVVGRLSAELGAGEAADGVVEPAGHQAGG